MDAFPPKTANLDTDEPTAVKGVAWHKPHVEKVKPEKPLHLVGHDRRGYRLVKPLISTVAEEVYDDSAKATYEKVSGTVDHS